ACNLLLHRIARPQRHGHELTYHVLCDAKAVEPGLLGNDHVVAFRAIELGFPGFAADRVDLASSDLDRAGITMGTPTTTKANPHRFGLGQRHDPTAAFAPALRRAVDEVVEMPQRESAEPGRERIALAVVGYAQCSLKLNLSLGVFVNLREPKI